MRRLATLLLIAGWITSVTWYWREHVPLVQTKSVPFSARSGNRMLAANGELVVRPYLSPPGQILAPQYGPVEFWTFPDCRKSRKLFTAADQIVSGPSYWTETVLIRRQNQLLIASTETGEPLATLPNLPNARSFHYLRDRNRCLLLDDQDLHLIDLKNSSTLWTVKKCQFLQSVGDDFVVVQRQHTDQQGRSAARFFMLDLETGELDKRFEEFAGALTFYLPPGRRLALVGTDRHGQSVVDMATGRIVWTVPRASGPQGFSFSPDGTELHVRRPQADGTRTFARWRSADGQPLPELSDWEKRVQTSIATPDGRYAITPESSQANAVVRRVIDWARNLASRGGWVLQISLTDRRFAVFERESARKIGYLPDRSEPMTLRNSLGLICFKDGMLHYYALPPRPNYGWLAAWTLGPLALFVVTRAAWRKVQQRGGENLPC